MSKSIKILLPTLILLLSAGQASATYTAWWAVDWAPGISTIRFNLTNLHPTDVFFAGISGATGRESATSAGINISGQYSEFAPVFCVDLRQFASSNFSGAFEVDVNTQADGNSGWTSPANDGDELRSAAGLQRAAALASYYGTTWANTGSILQGATATDRNDRAIALNVAIWQAAYGSNFLYVSGMNAAQLGYYNTYYKPYYDSGATFDHYKWWDSKALDAPSTNQDFISGVVPEPSSLLLLGTFLAGGAALPRLRRRKRSA